MTPDFFDWLVSGPYGPVAAALWGALWGSFLNVVIERLPRGESLVRPGSHCLQCGQPIRAYDNIPILSFLILRGRCRHCKARFSARYLLVELLALVLALACYYHATRVVSGTAAQRLAVFLVEFFFVAALLAILFIDIRTMIIPDVITLPMILILPTAQVVLGRVLWQDAVIGAAFGFGLVWLLRQLWWRLRREEGIGLGDAKLLAAVGGMLGWQALPAVLLLGSLQGILVTVPLRLAGRSLLAREPYQGTAVRAAEDPSAVDPSADDRAPGEAREAGEALEVDELPAGAVPFGPFLALAALEALFFQDWLRAWFTRGF